MQHKCESRFKIGSISFEIARWFGPKHVMVQMGSIP